MQQQLCQNFDLIGVIVLHNEQKFISPDPKSLLIGVRHLE
ncbi:hypothetical protein QOZ95_004085 [Paenibacillus brasilensis]|uniref:Uncharacterized protein n=1 Tax=Paenibacillus brasilensis TaxID=128574 RepID=A0ABU0L3N2_9BACL|nr:hypothetical protein [Paenibacillus brasilensis]